MEGREEYIFEQLGDALRVGLQCELQELCKKDSEHSGENLYASLAYMYITGLVDEETVSYVQHKISFDGMAGIDFVTTLKVIATKIFEKLLETYQFADLEELVPLLNQQEIPKWCFEIGDWLVCNSYAQPFLHGKHLYYILKLGGKTRFVRIPTDAITSKDDLEDGVCQEILGDDYEAILGFDGKLKCVYLRAYNQQKFFHCYNLVTRIFTIYDSEFVDFNNQGVFVLSKEGWLQKMLGAEKYNIKPALDYEEYEVREDRIVVWPRDVQKRCFYPYCVTFEGDIISADAEDCQKFIWRKIVWLFRGQGTVNPPKELSIRLMKERLEKSIPSSARCDNENYVFFDNILNLLSTYVDADKDIARLLYVLYECGNKAEATCALEHAYWKLRNWKSKNSKELEELLNNEDYQKLEEILAEEKEYWEPKSARSRIGTFEFFGEELQTECFDLNGGIILGSQIVPPVFGNEKCGIVTYECTNRRYCVTSRFPIEEKKKLQILKDFNLNSRNAKFVVFAGDPQEALNLYAEEECRSISEEEWECYLDPELWQEEF